MAIKVERGVARQRALTALNDINEREGGASPTSLPYLLPWPSRSLGLIPFTPLSPS